MITEPTTVVVQRYLEALARDQPAEPIARARGKRREGKGEREKWREKGTLLIIREYHTQMLM